MTYARKTNYPRSQCCRRQECNVTQECCRLGSFSVPSNPKCSPNSYVSSICSQLVTIQQSDTRPAPCTPALFRRGSREWARSPPQSNLNSSQSQSHSLLSRASNFFRLPSQNQEPINNNHLKTRQSTITSRQGNQQSPQDKAINNDLKTRSQSKTITSRPGADQQQSPQDKEPIHQQSPQDKAINNALKTRRSTMTSRQGANPSTMTSRPGANPSTMTSKLLPRKDFLDQNDFIKLPGNHLLNWLATLSSLGKWGFKLTLPLLSSLLVD
ncbi:hypothetical protein PGT21_012754 [Puccinia graminis f. sp. tritici]|uniref:Uncharacterized protein n=1 Tax=Puccinia graminis f. sp. tritici TaxID=56615 RepID=A0A5B0LQJ9_PUCGR|nr:hypothetical protein PGT21_012754 [Puccinia graminis f. sp. tritici]